ncbi:hypothetical protein Tco_1208162 [Tanacetum coccineum]
MANFSEDMQSAGSDTAHLCLIGLTLSLGNNIFTCIVKEKIMDRVFADLTPDEKDRYKADVHATNILLQGLSKDIYIIINHYTDAKDIWDNVKMLLEGSELTKDELIMEYLVKISKKVRILELKQRHLKITGLTSIRHFHDLRSVETEFLAIVFNDELTSEKALSCEPTVSSLNNNKIDFRISFDESDDEDYTVIFERNSFSYKIISVNKLKMDWENDNKKVNMPSFPSSKPTDSYFNDLDFFKDFEKEFPAIIYNDALMSKLDFLTEPTVSP